MFSKLFNKNSSNFQKVDLNPRVVVHYGVPSTASRLAYDPIQQFLAVGTLDGRIKIIGSDNIEGLLLSPKAIPFRNLEFLHNQGLLLSISNENDIQVWDLEHRCITVSLQWPSSVTALAVIQQTNYMYIGDESGLLSVLKYDVAGRKLLKQQFSIAALSVFEAAGTSLLDQLSIVRVLPQPCSCGSRVLFAYNNGVIVLWDIAKDELVLIQGLNSKQIKDVSEENPNHVRTNEQKDKNMYNEKEDKEIVSLCWASLDGSILATGYVDGDIMFWNLSASPTTIDHQAMKRANDMVKFQLSSADRRFPVIDLHWSSSGEHGGHGGQLFVYGGDEIGSPEVVTILCLEWSPQRDVLKNVKRANINLEGSFADMVLLESFSSLEDTGTMSLFLLTSPGQLQLYDSRCLSGLISHEDESCTIPVNYRSAVPTTEPYLTVGRLISVHENAQCSVAFSEMALAVELERTHQGDNTTTKWPLNGGVPCQLHLSEDTGVERLYIAGYQDGSVRIWDATYPMLSPLCSLYPEKRGSAVSGAIASISALDFSCENLNVAAGEEGGVVCIYDITRNQNQAKFYVVTGTENEVHNTDQGNGSQLSAVFALSTSRVCSLKYTQNGARLAVGYESGQVALLNISTPSILCFIDALSGSKSSIVSLSAAIFLDAHALRNGLGESEPHGHNETTKELIFALRSDMLVAILDSSDGNVINSVPRQHKESTAISMYILDGTKCVSELPGGICMHLSSEDKKANTLPKGQSDISSEGNDQTTNVVQSSVDFQILLCCKDVLLLYSFKSLIQGHANCIHEVNLLKPICWTSVFKIDEDKYGLFVLYQNGSFEIRSLPKLEVLGELSLLSVLRWNFKTNMEKTMSSTENGQIALVNGCELAILSLLAWENDFRIPESLPCLHDKALATAVNTNFSQNQKKVKETPSGILGGIIKGLTGAKEAQSMEEHVEDQKSLCLALDRIFSRPSEDTSIAARNSREAAKLDIEDIEIDGPLQVLPIVQKSDNVNKDKSAERKKLFEGATFETKPKPRTVDEIKAKYRGDTSSAASTATAALEARNKLMERGEKLERINQNSEELRNGAENFASMAKEIRKRMENRKWWQL